MPKRFLSLCALASVFVSVLASCTADDAQREAVCERSVAIETAVLRVGALADETKTMNAAVLRSQIDEDLANLTATLDVAPESIVGDLSTILARLRDLYGALEILEWDNARFVGDEQLDEALVAIGSVNSRRHLARLSGYIIDACDQTSVGGVVPPDSVVALPPTSTSLPSTDDPIPTDEDLLTAHVAMGTAIAESAGLTVTVEEAECLGREADLVALPEDLGGAPAKDTWNEAFLRIFPKCGVNAPDRPAP